MKLSNCTVPLFILTIALLCVGCENRVESAKKLWQEKSQNQAISKLNEELTKNPSNVEAKKLIEVYQTEIDQQSIKNIAVELIRKQSGYPKNYDAMFSFNEGTPSQGYLYELVRNGWFVQHGNNFVPTELGISTFSSVVYEWKVFYVTMVTHKEDVGAIDEVLVDSKNGTAIVTYNIIFSPVEQFSKFNVALEGRQIPEPRKAQVSLKKWDSGWRIQ